jgi:periplasmic protein TonB
MRAQRVEASPAFFASAVLHVLILTALLISWRFSHEIKMGSVVPVTIVAQGPPADLKPAELAPQPQTAQTEAPIPEAKPEVTPPPAPAKPPPPPKKVETPKPEPAPAPAPKKSAPAKPEKSLDLDALAASLTKPVKSAPPKPSSAARGASQPETALVARNTPGTALSAAAMQGLIDDLERRWNPNCEVAAGRDLIVRVVFSLGSYGQVIGDVRSQLTHGDSGPVGAEGARRARAAVFAAQPFRNLPRDLYGQTIAVNFNGKDACS